MTERSERLAVLDKEGRAALEKRLLDRQSDRCFICDQVIDLILSQGQLDIDHIVPLAEDGPDEENNFALCHASCNRSKGAADLRVARRMAEFERLQKEARARRERGANLGHILSKYGGSTMKLRLKTELDKVQFTLSGVGDEVIRESSLYTDPLSKMKYFYTILPLQYLHHDDRINPRSIGTSIRGLIEEFMKGRPQLHVALAWWAPDEDGAGPVKVFDGQHKAAAQILLGVNALPVRVFVQPDMNLLLQANTNAGDKLRQVAFDVAVLRHLGSTLFWERARQYQQMKSLREDELSFSEADLVRFFKGEHREMQKYIIDAVRDAITVNTDNKLMEFVEWSGKGADRPLAYNSIERSFFKEFVYKKALETSLDDGVDQGTNPRLLERDQLVRLMSLFAEVFFVGHWDPDIGGRRLESRLQQGEAIPEGHLRAWRIAREEILQAALAWVRLVMEHYYAWTGQVVDKDRLLHRPFPEELWRRIERFLRSLSELPCWIDRNLSLTIFGTKQLRDTWMRIFETGVAPTGVRVLTKPLDLNYMIQEPARVSAD
jgi:hypothetical protein